MIVAVGSLNPAKIEAARLAFDAVWPGPVAGVRGFDVSSGVAAQPMTDAEAIRGARNRAATAIGLGQADYGVGIEGGLQQTEGSWFNSGWAVVLDRAGREGVGSTLRMQVPLALMDLVLTGQELGEACDVLFGRTNANRSEGFIGLMTSNALHRTGALCDAVIAALTPFLHPAMNDRRNARP
ncbi:MAG TPA: inosine/xanthosine triphosphatase [Streptosporangiaceae bacterium]|nr:inosine/xanthosine triphosphatase [Streptosporangiaceae bacterium]